MSDEIKNILKSELVKARDFFNPRQELTGSVLKIWCEVLGHCTPFEIEDGFSNWYKKGKFMPKPSEILSLAETRKEYHKVNKEPGKPEELPECDPVIATAWILFNRMVHDMSFGEPLIAMTTDQAIMICNLEAKRAGTPSAIPKQFWLEEAWGMEKPIKLEEQEKQELKIAATVKHKKAPIYSGVMNEM